MTRTRSSAGPTREQACTWRHRRSGSRVPDRAPCRPPSRRSSRARAWPTPSTPSVWSRAALCLVVALALQVAVNYANDYSDGIRGTDADRVGPLRLVGSGAAERGGREARGVPGLRSRCRRRAGPRGPDVVVAGAGRSRVDPGRVGLHRRAAAVRLRRPRRAVRLRLLRAGGGLRDGVRPGRGVHRCCPSSPRSPSACSPARSSSRTTCATCPATPRPASAPSRCKLGDARHRGRSTPACSCFRSSSRWRCTATAGPGDCSGLGAFPVALYQYRRRPRRSERPCARAGAQGDRPASSSLYAVLLAVALSRLTGLAGRAAGRVGLVVRGRGVGARLDEVSVVVLGPGGRVQPVGDPRGPRLDVRR